MKTKRYSLFVLLAGIATVASMVLMISMTGGEIARPAEYPNRLGFTQAIFQFEMVQSPEEVRSVLGEPADPAGIALRRAMDITNTYDYIFMVCYPLLFAALLLFMRRLLADTGIAPSHYGILVAAGISLCVAMCGADAYENVLLFRLSACADLLKIDQDIITRLMTVTRIKSGAIILTGVILVYFYVLHFRKSWKLLLPLVYAVSGILSVISITVGSQRALMETGASIGMIGWIISIVHGGYWFFRKRS